MNCNEKEQDEKEQDVKEQDVKEQESWQWDLNPQPTDYKSVALPIELCQHSTLAPLLG
jgi:hypothetical protein